MSLEVISFHKTLREWEEIENIQYVALPVFQPVFSWMVSRHKERILQMWEAWKKHTG